MPAHHCVDFSPPASTHRLRRETAAELAARRVAKSLVKEWHEYRRVVQQQEQEQAERASTASLAAALELRVGTMRTLYPRLQGALKRFLPVPGDRGGWSGAKGESGEGWGSSGGSGEW